MKSVNTQESFFFSRMNALKFLEAKDSLVFHSSSVPLLCLFLPFHNNKNEIVDKKKELMMKRGMDNIGRVLQRR